jgi:undecaprenyl-phosphate 4-deoxy-4-formamido-L-arabinose transferase
MVAVLVLAGVQLIVVGLIGEYLGRMFLAVNRKPQYLIREVFTRGEDGVAVERPPVNTQAASRPYRVPSVPREPQQ